MLGHEFCQKVFYLVCTFIWIQNKVEARLREYQKALVEDVFGYYDMRGFTDELKVPTEVSTFNGKNSGFIGKDHLSHIVRQIGILGPVAVFFGRDIEQEFIKGSCWYSIKESLFQESIENSKTAIGEKHFLPHDHPDMEFYLRTGVFP